jgi:CheY-like chemotaxis protein
MTTNAKPINIYLAEDDTEDMALFAQALEESELSVEFRHFESGMHLLECLNTSECPLPDIIFLDLRMPMKSGKECLREIRANKKFNHVPVIIFTCTTYLDDIKETFQFGANLYVPKSVFIKNQSQAITMILQTVLNPSSLSPTPERFVLQGSNPFIWI